MKKTLIQIQDLQRKTKTRAKVLSNMRLVATYTDSKNRWYANGEKSGPNPYRGEIDLFNFCVLEKEMACCAQGNGFFTTYRVGGLLTNSPEKLENDLVKLINLYHLQLKDNKENGYVSLGEGERKNRLIKELNRAEMMLKESRETPYSFRMQRKQR